jgi:hypothetical protein
MLFYYGRGKRLKGINYLTDRFYPEEFILFIADYQKQQL